MGHGRMQILRQAFFRSLARCFAILPLENFSFFLILGTAKLPLPQIAASDQDKVFCFSSGCVNFGKITQSTRIDGLAYAN